MTVLKLMLLCRAGVVKKLNTKEQFHSIMKLRSQYKIITQILIPIPMALGVDDTNGHRNENTMVAK